MDFTIKTEPDPQFLCVACLNNDRQMFEEHEIQQELILTYKGIINDFIIHVESVPIVICLDCMEMLNNFKEFQRKCLESMQVLLFDVEKIKAEDEPEEMNVDQIYSPLVKLETNPLDDVLKFDMEVEEPKEKVESEPHPPKPKRIRPSKSKCIEAFCPVCCNSHPDSHNHAIELHSRGYETDGSLNCLVCSHVCKDVNVLLHHLESHTKFDHPKKCGRCDMVSRDRHEFLQHVQKTHFKQRKRFYTCDFCDSVFYQSINLKYHTRSHLGGLKCNYCEKAYFDKNVYEEHIEMHKERLAQVKFICDYCGYVAQFKPSLKKHMLHHHTSSEEKVMCHICNKTYKAKFQLTKHLYTSHKEKKLPCSFCGKVFGTRNTLNKHVNRVHAMDAAQKRLIRERERPKVRKHACEECDMKFYQLGALKKHKHTHTKTRPFNCTLCKSGYYTNIYLRKHFLRQHGIVYTPKEIRKICGIKYNVEDSD